jgi:tetratricopeptide (TPR) repeat protein
MSLSRSGSFRLFLSVIALVAAGVIIGFWVATSIGPRADGMAVTSGTGSSTPGMTMPGMTMPPQAPSGTEGRTAELAAAHADVEAGRFANAVPVYERILREDPHHVEALIHYGVALAGVGQVERGLAELDRALAMVPDHLHALWSKAQTLFDVKLDYAASIPVWERVAGLASSPVDAATARGYVLRARERLNARQQPAPGTGSR